MTGLTVSELDEAERVRGSAQPLAARRGPWAIALVLGLFGAIAITLATPRLVTNRARPWWFASPVVAHAGATALLYAGLGALVAAWLALGHLLARDPGAPPRLVLAFGAIWSLPLVLGPPLFSRDMYSYLAQGTILRLGHNPYRVAPTVLARLGATRVLAAVDPFWRHTTAPYGPLFVAICAAVAAVFGSKLVGAIVVLRLVEVAGLVLAAVFVPRLARRYGADERLALWLVIASPITLLELVAAGHSDALMIGLMVAGLCLALDGRVVVGVGVLALAAMVKAPAGVAIVFVLAALARSAGGRRAAARVVTAGIASALAVLVAVSAATGLGIDWISTGDFSTPARVLLATTPAGALAWTSVALARASATDVHRVADASSAALLALTGALALFLLSRVRRASLLPALGAVLCCAALAGPAAWPWYFTWGIALLACWPGAQRSVVLIAGTVVATFVVKPGGTLALPIKFSPVFVVAFALLGAAAYRYWWPRRHARAT